MITDLNQVEHDTIGGHYIDVKENNIRNPRIHQSLVGMGRLCLFMLEADSNNTSSKVRPRDIRRIRAQWDNCKSEFEFNVLEENNDLPSGSHEYAYKVYTVDEKEIQRVRNSKIQSPLAAVWDCMNTMLSIDSSNTQGFTAQEDIDDCRLKMAFCDRVLDRHIGKGSDLSDTGLQVPAFEELGEIRPSLTQSYAQRLEPSKKVPAPRIPDAQDTKLED